MVPIHLAAMGDEPELVSSHLLACWAPTLTTPLSPFTPNPQP